MTITITAFAASPDRGRGLARDMRVRWVLEELGLPYEVRLLSFAELKEPAHRALQPFGQIPTFEDGAVTLFDSGAIALHLALAHPGLLPDDPALRARALSWTFGALTTVEPPIVEREQAGYAERGRDWVEARDALMAERVRVRLGDLARALGSDDWLAGAFSLADLVMAGVLMRVSADLLAEVPPLPAYLARAQARPAYARAFAAQRQVYLDAQAAGRG